MSYTVIPKLIVTFPSGRTKPEDVWIWATIKLNTDHDTYISNITQGKIAYLTGINIRAVRRSIKRLKEEGFLEIQTRNINGCQKRNSYHFKKEKSDFFLVDNRLFHKKYAPEIAGFMFLLRAITLNNTNKVLWSKTKIAEAIGVNRNSTALLLAKCEQMGLVKSIPDGYEIIEPCLSYTVANRKIASRIYGAICEFCIDRGVNPPSWDNVAVSVISTRYFLEMPTESEFSLIGQLEKRCNNLPQGVTMRYFVTVLGMKDQYNAVKAAKSAITTKDYAF